jgi:predicted RNA-binding protein with RPS1 domain
MCQMIIRVLIRIERQNKEDESMARVNKMPKVPVRAKDMSKEWRACQVYTWSHAFNEWIKENHRVTVKPNESARLEERFVAQAYNLPLDCVILSPTLDAE